MKILILNSSPRRNGNISKMLEAMKQEIECCNAEAVYVRVPELKVRPCIGCMKCRSSLRCCLPEDDAQRVLQSIRDADALIIGAPCYWGNMPGELKVLFDRMVYGMMGENSLGMPLALHKGKKVIIVSTCTTPYPFNILYNQTRGGSESPQGNIKVERLQSCESHREGWHQKASGFDFQRDITL